MAKWLGRHCSMNGVLHAFLESNTLALNYSLKPVHHMVGNVVQIAGSGGEGGTGSNLPQRRIGVAQPANQGSGNSTGKRGGLRARLAVCDLKDPSSN